jgi:hypothetical protein
MMGPLLPPLLLAVLALLLDAAGSAAMMEVSIEADGSFAVEINSQRWLKSAPVRAFVGGAWRVPAHVNTSRSTGTDSALGSFNRTNVTWAIGAGADQVPMHTSIQLFGDGVAMFTTELPRGASGTNASNPVLPHTWEPGTAGARRAAGFDASGGPPPGLPNHTQWSRYHDNGIYPPSIGFPAFSAHANDSLLPALGFVTWADCQIPSLHGVSPTTSLQGLSASGVKSPFSRRFLMENDHLARQARDTRKKG